MPFSLFLFYFTFSFIHPHHLSPLAMDQCIEQLHFDIPLISTRRVAGSPNAIKARNLNSNESDCIDTSRRVPFSWEAAPGVPKSSVTRIDTCKEEVLTPRPPPGRWRPPNLNKIKTNNNAVKHNVANVDVSSNDSDDDLFSKPGLEKVSSFESVGRPAPVINGAPSFIMSRFLPAANALAAASLTTANLPKYRHRRIPSSGSREQPAKLRLRQRTTATDAVKVHTAGYSYSPCTVVRPASPSTGRRLVDFFPWSLKRVMCRFRSPVRCQNPKIATLEGFAQRSRRISGDGLSSNDGVSSKACKSPGWGLPFLDTSRLRIRGGGVDINKGRRLVEGKELKDGRTPRRTGGGVVQEYGRPIPVFQSPTESWLAHALNSVNRS